jgi:hypothetical protein
VWILLKVKFSAGPSSYTPCSLGLSATSQQYFSVRMNQPPAISRNQPAVLFSQNKSAPAISHQPTEQADTYHVLPLFLFI